MADNVTVDNGDLTDYTVSADDAGASGQVQRVKLAYSADGVATHVQADADGVLVNLGANNDVTVTGTVTATDGGSTLSVDDGGGTLTVDGSVSVSGTVDTELPSAAALADNTANPTAPGVGSFPHWYDGSTWDRAPGTAADGLLVNLGANNDVTVSGTVSVTEPVTVDNGGTFAVQVSSAIPAGTNNIGDVDIASVPAPLSTTGAGTEAAALRVTVATDSTGVLSVDDNGGSLTVDAASLPLPTGASTSAKQDTIIGHVDGIETLLGGGLPSALATDRLKVDASGVAVPVTDNAGSLTVDAPVGTPVFVRLSDGSSAIATLPVSIAATVTTKEARASTSSLSNVASSAASVTVLASNANRLGATVFNDSTQVLYLKFGATASSSSYTVQLAAGAYYEVPFGYTGILDGIWASANGSARVTEVTA